MNNMHGKETQCIEADLKTGKKRYCSACQILALLGMNGNSEEPAGLHSELVPSLPLQLWFLRYWR